jgi:predicted transcriptional regulator
MAKGISKQQEEQMRKEDALDLLLYRALEAMRKPIKLGMDKDGQFVELYPVPVFSGNKVKAVEYKTSQAVELPDDLFERLCILEDEIEKKAPKAKKVKASDKETRGRKPKHTENEALHWVELKEQGFSYGEIAELTGANKTSVANYIRKYNKKIREELKAQKEAEKQAKAEAKEKAKQDAREAKEAEKLAKAQAREAERQARKAQTEAEKAHRAGRMVKQMKAEELMYVWAEEYKAGTSSIQIADKYNLSDQTVRNYLKKVNAM